MATWLLVGGPRHGEEINAPVAAHLDVAVYQSPWRAPNSRGYRIARYHATFVANQGGTWDYPDEELRLLGGIFTGYDE